MEVLNMRTFNFTEEQANFIRSGTAIDITPNKDVSLTKDEAIAIIDYSFDIESEEINDIEGDEDLSPLGYTATRIINMLTVKN